MATANEKKRYKEVKIMVINIENAIIIIGIGILEVLFGIWLFNKLVNNIAVYNFFDKINPVIDDFVFELLVHIPWLENRARSSRLGKEDIEAMSKKGYNIFDADKGRFVKEIPEAMKQLIV
jgi:hypothetical protein